MTVVRRKKGKDETIKVKQPEDFNSAQNENSKTSKPVKLTLKSRIYTFLKYAVFVFVAPPIINYAALQKEYAHFRNTSTLYDVGWGQLVRMHCVGSGSPTVVLDAPTGETADYWWKLQLLLANHTRVCSYDRAGLGLSDRPYRNGTVNTNNQKMIFKSLEFTAERMWEDISRLVGSASSQQRPILLVGAELGSLVSRFFAHMAPDGDVCGLMMLNPLSDALFTGDNGRLKLHWKEKIIPSYEQLHILASLGIARLSIKAGLLQTELSHSAANSSYIGAADVVWRQNYAMSHPRHVSSVVDEHYYINESLAQLRMVRRVKPIPDDVEIVVLHTQQYDRTESNSYNKVWKESVDKVKSEVPARARFTQLTGDRQTPWRRPRVVLREILKLIESCRHRFATSSH